jgi:hypothetical protein
VDAVAFFNRVTAAGGTLSVTEQKATNQLVLNMKSAGIWSAMKAIYPMVGASAAACAQNLKSSSFTGAFSTGWTFASTGVKGNLASTFMDTGLVPFVDLLQDNMHTSIYSRTDNSNAAYDFGSSDSVAKVDGYLKYETFGARFNLNSGDAFRPFFYPTTSTGFFQGSKLSNISRKIFYNGVLQNTNTTLDIKTLNNYNIYLGALNNVGVSYFPSNREYCFFSIGIGLTDSQSSNFYTAVQAFQTTLSRQV